MAPSTTAVSLRLTEPVVFLTGGQEHERARARRRRANRRASVATNNTGNQDDAGLGGSGTLPADTGAGGSRSNSRSNSPAPPPIRPTAGNNNEERFVHPGPSRSGRSLSRDRSSSAQRGESPAPGGDSRSRSRARPMETVHERGALTTGSGTAEEADEMDEPPPAMLRGLLTLTLSKPSRIRDITLKLRGIARTEWPEGIGPRRLDVMEESTLIDTKFTFFSASNLSNERRAASIGPGIAGDYEHNHRARSRSTAPDPRRSASVMPTRDSSVGHAYTRDSAFFQQQRGAEASGGFATVLDERRRRMSEANGGGGNGAGNLSRIASSSNLEEPMPGPPPPIEPGEPSPAYELVPSPSLPSSPMLHPVLVRDQSIDSPSDSPLHSPALNTTALPRQGAAGRFDTTSPIPSPLGPSRAPSISESPSATTLHSSLTRLSQEDTTPSTAPASPVQNPGNRPSLHHEPSNDSTTSSHSHHSLSRQHSNSVSRPTSLLETSDPEAAGARTRSGSGTGGSPNASGILATSTAASTSKATSAAAARPSSLSRVAGGSNGGGRSSSASKTRFSLAGLTEALRAKSSSRSRAPREGSLGGSGFKNGDSEGRREESPVRTRERDGESRGRKTALKALRHALTHEDGPSNSGGGAGDGDDDSDDEIVDERSSRSKGWKEFRAGTYSYPISIPIAASLPPTINAEFGTVMYALKATVHRAGALTANLTAVTGIMLVSTPGQDDTEENESIVVERFWETQMKYNIALSGKSFPIGGHIPISIRLNPMAKVKLYRISAILEQKTTYFASGRKLTRHETPKKYPLMRIEMKDPKEALLPILSDDVDAINNHPLAKFFINPTSSDDTTPQCFDPIGPWHLESTIKLPDCSSRLNFSTIHDKANINISHVLKIMLRVERGDDDFLDSKGKRKLWDVIIETPIHILSCKCTQNVLPAYSTVSSGPGPSGSASSSGASLSFNNTQDCGFNHLTNQPTRGQSTLSYSGVRSSSAHHQPTVTTVEQNMLFARLVAGEETPAGEVPPTYQAVINHDPSAGTEAVVPVLMERTDSSMSDITTRGRTGRQEEEPRGRSSSVARDRHSAPTSRAVSRQRAMDVDNLTVEESMDVEE
ncbi:hypothetical protein T439DRAFT_327607 [Meredithblackwellia eburnea MCA 4105]